MDHWIGRQLVIRGGWDSLVALLQFELGFELGPVFGIEAPKQLRSEARIAGLTAK